MLSKLIIKTMFAVLYIHTYMIHFNRLIGQHSLNFPVPHIYQGQNLKSNC